MSRRRKRASREVPNTTVSDNRFQSIMGAFISQIEGDVSAAFDDIEDLERAVESIQGESHSCETVQALAPMVDKLRTNMEALAKSSKELEIQHKLLAQKHELLYKVLWGVGSAAALGIFKLIMDLITAAMK